MLDTINSAPPQLKERMQLLTLANFSNVTKILRKFRQKVKDADITLVMGSHQFLFTAGSMCLLVAKIAGKPCYFRTFGYLDLYYKNLSPISQWLFRFVVRQLDGLFVETQMSHAQLADVLGNKVSSVSGYRHMPATLDGFPGKEKKSNDKLRLISLSQVREDKGIFVLLESLRNPSLRSKESIHCDIYGPLHQTISERFEAELVDTPNATYKGVLNPDEIVSVLSKYDALVFPTFYKGEGHPGVIMEAMMAGIPVIATAFRSIPELIEDRVNGLLVIPQDSKSLAEAIRTIYDDRRLLAAMARKNWEMRKRYAAHQVVPLILRLVGVDIKTVATFEK